jgi:hypothetical protein
LSHNSQKQTTLQLLKEIDDQLKAFKLNEDGVEMIEEGDEDIQREIN